MADYDNHIIYLCWLKIGFCFHVKIHHHKSELSIWGNTQFNLNTQFIFDQLAITLFKLFWLVLNYANFAIYYSVLFLHYLFFSMIFCSSFLYILIAQISINSYIFKSSLLFEYHWIYLYVPEMFCATFSESPTVTN